MLAMNGDAAFARESHSAARLERGGLPRSARTAVNEGQGPWCNKSPPDKPLSTRQMAEESGLKRPCHRSLSRQQELTEPGATMQKVNREAAAYGMMMKAAGR